MLFRSHVVTANKALLAHHGTALAKAAEAKGVTLAFEASVAGGIPIVKALREGLAGNRIGRLYGILNGTCNYILTTMRKTGRAFGDVLAEAQKLGYAEAGIKKPGRKDVLLMTLAPTATVVGVFTTNRFCAAPVQLAKQHLASGKGIRALVINTGNANAGTGESGLANANDTCEAVAKLLGCEATQVLPFSTGVILEPLPVDRLLQQSLKRRHGSYPNPGRRARTRTAAGP